jgi:hypothetical protein
VAEKIASMVEFTNNYQGYRGNHYPTTFRNFMIENVICKSAAKTGVHIVGVPDAHIDNVFLRNVTIDRAKVATEIRYVDNVDFQNVTINGNPQPASPRPTPISKKPATKKKIRGGEGIR